ncbi:TPA: DUF4365 domain-containing protein [Vibrio vulnificus]|nr:DUF4365 domain-containing protein [Vibrio vulnificus]EHH0849778.1 DUF4365 domain-containing protein [Vibrio vulnificus]EJX1092908.1 DUF4365 domain-containing protein [Vibrio vulnificus]HAS8321955.1 DUF4365 domain-containing protein [Vibrio vulnificus]HAS8618192.1 DUF4365 domain-containing protein [Vibrio vulnificus]
MCLGEILRVKAPKSELVSRAGVHYAGYVFSTEGIIFRETSSSDVGIDGQLELVSDDGTATGMLLGVQVKSGDSFVDNISGIFSFKSNKEHFEYWQQLRIPTIGVVYSPTLKKASWFDLTKYANLILKNDYPSVIKQEINESNVLEIGQGLTELIKLAHQYYELPVTKEDVEKLVDIQEQAVDTQSSKEDSWKRLISIFFSSDSDSDVIGEVGYRLSWYFPTVSDSQKEQFKNRLKQLTLAELNRIFCAIKLAFERNRDDVVSLILDLVSYHPQITELFDKLEANGFITSEDKWLLERFKEYLEQL